MSKATFDCDICSKVFDKAYKLRKHVIIHSEVRPFLCTNCELTFKTPGHLKKHIKLHAAPTYQCEQCDAKFKQQRGLWGHVIAIHGYYCSTCAEVFFTSPEMVAHKILHPLEKINPRTKHVCEICTKGFPKAHLLLEHKSIHSEERSFECQYCNKRFKQKNGAYLHEQRVHVRMNRVPCPDCGKTFSLASGLDNHQLIHRNEKPYKCEICGNLFTLLTNLKTHMERHAKVYKYGCPDCEQKFTTKVELCTHHKYMHILEKNIKCESCDFTCKVKSQLKDHTRIHTGEKPYACEFCGNCFSTSGNCHRHERHHETVKNWKFVCDFQDGGTQKAGESDMKCTIRCKTAEKLDFHIQGAHTETGLRKKLFSENAMARFFDAHEISYDRDRVNHVTFKGCEVLRDDTSTARAYPDFYLTGISAKIGAVVIVGNDEFAHRRYDCDFRRTFDIAQSIGLVSEFQGVPMVYIRFNPHHFFLFHIRKKLFPAIILQATKKIIINKLTIQKPKSSSWRKNILL